MLDHYNHHVIKVPRSKRILQAEVAGTRPQNPTMENLSEDECMVRLRQLDQDWVIYQSGTPSFRNLFDRLLHNASGGGMQLTTTDVVNHLQTLREDVANLHNRLFHLGTFAANQTAKAMMQRLLAVVSYTFIMIKGALRTQQAVTNASDSCDIASSFYSFSNMTGVRDLEDIKPYQKLLIHICCQAQKDGYRRYNDYVYKPLSTDEGHVTHSWEKVCDIKTYIFNCCRREYNWDQWCLLTEQPSFVKHATTYLTEMEDYQFPRLEKDRHAFSMSNGIYLATEDRFAQYGTPAASAIPSGLCCAKHFPHPFPAEHTSSTWQSIPTPTLDTMLASQELEFEVRRWLYVFLGRLLYEVGEKDNW